MKMKVLTGALFAVSTLALATAPAQAKVLSAGNYSLAGIQQICLVSDGTWYGETFSGWGGGWEAGPTKDDGTILWGTYNSGAGEDSMIVGGKNLDWTEFHSDRSFVNFVDSTITKIKGACSPPAAKGNPHKNPMD